MAVSTCAFSHKVSINAPCAHRGRSLLRTAPRWRALSIMKATPQEGRTPVTPESSSAAPPAPKSTGDLAKEALIQTLASNEAMIVKDVLGESGLASLRKALGEERAGALTGVLDSLLTNRRLVTLVFAVLDVALILVLIKVFRSTVMPD